MADRSLTVRLRAEVDQFRKDMQQATQGVAGIGQAARAAGQQRTAIQQLGQAGREVGQTIAAASGVAAAGVAAIGVQTIRTGIAYNTLEQTTRAALGTLMGSTEAAEAQMDKLREFVETRLFPREVFIEAQQQMLSFGFAAERVIPILGTLEDAVAATGGSAQTFSEIVEILSRVQSTGKVTAETMNELGRRGINAAQLIGEAMGMTENEIRESITAGALDGREAIEQLVTAMETRFAGGAEALTTTWVGASGLVSAGLRNIGSSAVEAFIDPNGGGAAVDWANATAEALYAVNRALRPLVDELRQRADPAFERIADRIESVAARIDELDLVALLDQVRPAAPAFAALGAGIAAAGSASLLSAVGFGALSGAISPLGAAILAAVTASPELRDVLFDLLDALSPLLPVVTETGIALGTVLSTGLGVVAEVIGAVLPLVEGIVGAFTSMPEVVQQATLAIIAFSLALRFAGPAGVALTALAAIGVAVEGLKVAFGDNQETMDEWRSSITETTEDLERLARTGRTTGDLEQLDGIFRDLGDSLSGARDELNFFEREARGVVNMFGSFDFVPTEWTGPLIAFGRQLETTGEVMDEFRERLVPMDEALAQMVSSGDIDLAARAFDELAIKAAAAGISQEELLELLPEYVRQMERHEEETRDAAEAQDGMSEATRAATEALQEHHDELRAQVDPLFALHRAIRETEEAQTALDEAIEEFGEDSPEARDAALALAEATLELNGAALDASGSLNDQFIESLLSSMEAAGASEEAMRLVEDALRDVDAAGESINDEYETTVRLHGADSAAAAALRVRDRLNEIDRFINIHFNVTGQAPVGSIAVPMQHGGGVEHGPAGIDRVPAMLTRGEHVWTVDEVNAAGGHEAVAAMRAAILAGSSRFATGGPVGMPRFQRGGSVTGGDGAVLTIRSDGTDWADAVVGTLRRSADLAGGLGNLVRIEGP